MPDMRAETAVRRTLKLFGPSIIPVPRIYIGYHNRVEVDCDCIRILELQDYCNVAPAQAWNDLLNMALALKDVKISFISSTPQGGGVAMMRHSMVRLARLLGLDLSWFVVRPSFNIFKITKRKFHNVLQGISKEFLTREEIAAYEKWIQDNGKVYWKSQIFPESKIIVLDDPQYLLLILF